MSIQDVKARQEAEREKCLQAILDSKAKKKIIVAGPGTGKTFTFGKVLQLTKDGKNIAMTFINRLANDMNSSLADFAEVKTFHAYCKKILYLQNGRVILAPYLTKVIEKDAGILDEDVGSFDAKFQCLEENSPDLIFYLRRGDYYEVVSFNDSVYRLYKELKKDGNILPVFDQILIDEFQDFNALEVAFIDELEKRGPILIVGDDDQAIYDDRYASPDYLRDKFKSGSYETFELPFCIRCPDAIVKATNAIIRIVTANGGFEDRLPKAYECYLADKEKENEQYPKIIAARCTNAPTVAKYVNKAIANINGDDIAESWVEGKEYPTALIVGPRQYLLKIQKELEEEYPQLNYAKPGETGYEIVDGYDLLLTVPDNNLGWRILAEFFLTQEDFESILEGTLDGIPMVELLTKEFLGLQRRVIEIIRAAKSDGNLPKEQEEELKALINGHADAIIERFFPPKMEKVEIDKTKPSVLLTSFKGCKGLSAGHVLIVGANNGSIPADTHDVKDVEIGQFIVALTRTRKQCHIISNKWLYSPKDSSGGWIPAMERSSFVDLIPSELLEDFGELKAKDVEAL